MTTFNRIIAHLADKDKFVYSYTRRPFVCTNGIAINIQRVMCTTPTQVR
jgi:hypothetical protein